MYKNDQSEKKGRALYLAFGNTIEIMLVTSIMVENDYQIQNVIWQNTYTSSTSSQFILLLLIPRAERKAS